MCMGGGKDSYDAYKKGDYQRWQQADDQAAALQTQIDSGSLTGSALSQAQAQLASYNQQANASLAKVNNDPAARMDVREHNRQQDVTTGRGKIDKAFTQFDDKYYNDYGQKYLDYYTPQLNDQYAQARGKLTAVLAGKGMGASTVGIGEQGRLTTTKDTAATTIANQAQDAKNTLKSNVEKSKSDLYSLNESAADPASINNRAIGEATALVAPPAFSPIGQVFSNFLGNVVGGSQGATNPYYKPYQSPSFSGASGKGSGAVYGS